MNPDVKRALLADVPERGLMTRPQSARQHVRARLVVANVNVVEPFVEAFPKTIPGVYQIAGCLLNFNKKKMNELLYRGDREKVICDALEDRPQLIRTFGDR